MPKHHKTPTEWKAQLSELAYHVTREKGTEPAFSGQYWNTNEAGEYLCLCCDQPLFASADKFDAGCGWPSFSLPMNPADIAEHVDRSHGMTRTEVTCQHCGAHLGHVFPDGPGPQGLRYCINSASLNFKAK